jgi:hypothetical protein
LASDYAKLVKLVEQKTAVTNIKQTAGSMFEHVVPNDYGVSIREEGRVKNSKKDYEDVIKLMSLDHYQRKINVS